MANPKDSFYDEDTSSSLYHQESFSKSPSILDSIEHESGDRSDEEEEGDEEEEEDNHEDDNCSVAVDNNIESEGEAEDEDGDEALIDEEEYTDNHIENNFDSKSHDDEPSFDDEDAEDDDQMYTTTDDVNTGVDYEGKNGDISSCHSDRIASNDDPALESTGSSLRDNHSLDDAKSESSEISSPPNKLRKLSASTVNDQKRHSITSLANITDLTEGNYRVNFLSAGLASDCEDDLNDPTIERKAINDNHCNRSSSNGAGIKHDKLSSNASSSFSKETNESDDEGDTNIDEEDKLSLEKDDTFGPDNQEGVIAGSTVGLTEAELAVRNHFHREFGNIFDDGDGKASRLSNGAIVENSSETEYFCIFCEHRTKDKEAIRHHYQKHMSYYPIICSSCGFTAFDLPHFLDHHASSHPKAAKGRYKRREIAHIDRWINGFIYAQATIVRAFPPREQCPVCEIIFTSEEISSAKPRRCTINRKIDHLHRHLAYLPYECLKCKENDGKEFLVGYFESKAHSHIKLKHPEVDNQDRRWDLFQKTLGIDALDQWIADYLGKFGIPMTQERRPVKKQKLIETNPSSGQFYSQGDSDGDDFEEDCPELPQTPIEKLSFTVQASDTDSMTIEAPPEMVDLDLMDSAESTTTSVDYVSEEATSSSCSSKSIDYICIFCQYHCNKLVEISDHLAAEHFEYKPIRCLICQVGFMDMVSLSTHHLNRHASSGIELQFEVYEDFSVEKWIADFAKSQKIGTMKKLMLNCQCSNSCPTCCRMKQFAKMSSDHKADEKTNGPCRVHSESSFLNHVKCHFSYYQYQCLPCKQSGKTVKFASLKGDAFNHLHREHISHDQVSEAKVKSYFSKILQIQMLDEYVGGALTFWRHAFGNSTLNSASASHLANAPNYSSRLNSYPVTGLTEQVIMMQENIRRQLLNESLSPASLLLRKKQQKLHQQQLLSARGPRGAPSLRVITNQEGRMVVESFDDKVSCDMPNGTVNSNGHRRVPATSRTPINRQVQRSSSHVRSVNEVRMLPPAGHSMRLTHLSMNRPSTLSSRKQQQLVSNRHSAPNRLNQWKQRSSSFTSSPSSTTSHPNHIRIRAGRVVNLPQSPSPVAHSTLPNNNGNNRSIPKRSIYNLSNSNSQDIHSSSRNNQSWGGASLSHAQGARGIKSTVKSPSTSSFSLPLKCLHCNLTFPNLQLLKYHTVNFHKGLAIDYTPVQSFVM